MSTVFSNQFALFRKTSTRYTSTALQRAPLIKPSTNPTHIMSRGYEVGTKAVHRPYAWARARNFAIAAPLALGGGYAWYTMTNAPGPAFKYKYHQLTQHDAPALAQLIQSHGIKALISNITDLVEQDGVTKTVRNLTELIHNHYLDRDQLVTLIEWTLDNLDTISQLFNDEAGTFWAEYMPAVYLASNANLTGSFGIASGMGLRRRIWEIIENSSDQKNVLLQTQKTDKTHIRKFYEFMLSQTGFNQTQRNNLLKKFDTMHHLPKPQSARWNGKEEDLS